MTESIFDVVTENIKGPHVAKQMPEAPMKEHEREKGKNLLESCKISADFGNGIAGRDQAVNIDKSIQPDRLGILVKENDNIDTDDGIVHNRVIFGWDGVSQRNHLLQKPQSATISRAGDKRKTAGRIRAALCWWSLICTLESCQIQYSCQVVIPGDSRMSTQNPLSQ
jgi:hypothetical protein